MSVSLTDFSRLWTYYHVIVSYRYDVGTDKSFLSPCICVFGGRIRHSDTLSPSVWRVFLHFSRVTYCHVDNSEKKGLTFSYICRKFLMYRCAQYIRIKNNWKKHLTFSQNLRKLRGCHNPFWGRLDKNNWKLYYGIQSFCSFKDIWKFW